MRFELYELDPARFLSARRFVWQAAFKKVQSKIRLLTDIDMLLVVEEGIRRYKKRNMSLYLLICKS